MQIAENDQPEKIALIAGASGLVGGFLLNALLDSGYYKEVISIGRRDLPISHPRLKQVISGLKELPATLKADDYFCCLGTTISKAGSKEAFKEVDYDYPLTLAKVAENNHARFFVVTALGANPDSAFFYNRVKGKLEQALRKLKLPALHIFRPSLLVGKRNEQRFGEKAAQSISKLIPFIFIGFLEKYKPIPASMVAQAMLKAAFTTDSGTTIHESDDILHGF